jgi:ribosome-associated protein
MTDVSEQPQPPEEDLDSLPLEIDPIVLPMARLAVEAVSALKAEEISVLDVEGRCSYCDVLVLCTGRADRHVRAIAGNIVQEHKRLRGKPPLGVEGLASGKWVLVDLGDVLVHVFDEAARGYYDVDGLWMDARRIPFDELGLTDEGLPLDEPEATPEPPSAES